MGLAVPSALTTAVVIHKMLFSLCIFGIASSTLLLSAQALPPMPFARSPVPGRSLLSRFVALPPRQIHLGRIRTVPHQNVVLLFLVMLHLPRVLFAPNAPTVGRALCLLSAKPATLGRASLRTLGRVRLSILGRAVHPTALMVVSLSVSSSHSNLVIFLT
jgi:hypothetical protein